MAVAEEASVTRTVILETPVVLGVPVIAPAAESVSPPGSVPDAIDQVYGAVPPVATSVCEYCRLVAARRRGEGVVIVKVAVCVTVTGMPAIDRVAAREGPEFEAIARVRDAEPVPEAAPATVIQLGVPDTVHEQEAMVWMLTVKLPPETGGCNDAGLTA